MRGNLIARRRRGSGPKIEPLIINLALTGMVPTKDQTPHVPITVDEVLRDVERCRALGVSVVHVHAREEDGRPTHHKEAFRPLVEGIRAIDRELVVCVTCSGRSVTGLEQRAEVLELDGDARPDMGSLTLGSNNFPTQASVNPPEVIRGLATRMRDAGILPELEVFEPGMLAFAQRLVHEGLLPERCYVNVLLGNFGTSPISPASLAAFLALMPHGWTWALAGIGRFQLDANATALAAGGHVRTGIEDNIWFDRERTELATNEGFVERIVQMAELMDRPVATPAWTRARLGLGDRSGEEPAVVSGARG